MSYIQLLISVILLAANFSFRRVYTKKAGDTFRASVYYSFFAAIICAVFFIALGGGKISLNPFTVLMASASAIMCLAYTALSFKIMEEDGLAVFTLFLMAGGMTVPYIFGIAFLHEEFSLLRTFGLVLIFASLLTVNSGCGKINPKTAAMCIAVFLLNGFVSVVSKLHQISLYAAAENDFIICTYIVQALMCLAAFPLVRGKQPLPINSPRCITAIIASALAGGISYLLQLVCAKSLPATVLYPAVTGGSVVLTSLCGIIIFKEKAHAKLLIGIGLCFMGTCMFL